MRGVSDEARRDHLLRVICRRIGCLKPDGGLKDMVAGCHARHSPRRRDRSAAAGKVTQPERPDRLRTRRRTAAVPTPDHARRSPPARHAPRRSRVPAVERVRRPVPLSRIQDPGWRPDALRRPRPKRLASRQARLLGAGLEDRAPRHRRGAVSGSPDAKPPARDQQLRIPDHVLDPSSQPGHARPLAGAAPAAGRL